MKSERSREGHRQHNETDDSALMTLHGAHACIHPPPPIPLLLGPLSRFPDHSFYWHHRVDKHGSARRELACLAAREGEASSLARRTMCSAGAGGRHKRAVHLLSIRFEALSDKTLPPAGPHKTPPPEILCPGITSQVGQGVGEEQALIPAPGKAPDPAGQAPDPGAPGADPEEKALKPRKMT